MQRLFFLCSAVLSLAAVIPAAAHAQFQPPVDEELRMTSDPKAPGADAVYLDLEEIANDPQHYQSYYARIKVLTEKGKEMATVDLPYLKGNSKIDDIKGRTIHSDGTIIPLSGKPADLLSIKTGDKQFARKVFTLPSVEIGSILEYRYYIRYDDDQYTTPQWKIQRPYFVHKAHYQFTPFKSFMPEGTPGTVTNLQLMDDRGRAANSLIWWPILPPGISIKKSPGIGYSVDVTDVPPIPNEEWMPPIQSLLYRVNFYYSFAEDAGDFWISEGKLWSKDVDKFADPSKAIRDAVNHLVAPGDSDLDKAKKLYAAVQGLDNTSYSRQKTQSEMRLLKIKAAKRAEDTWTQKSGSNEDIAMLYLAMLRAAGLTAYAIKVVDRDQGIFDVAYQSLDQLDTTLVLLSSGGKETLLDPGEKMCPFGTVSWRHSAVRGLGQSSQGISISTTGEQVYKDNTVTRTAHLTLDTRGGVTGNIQFIMTGQDALYWRQTALRNDESELKNQFDQYLGSIVPEGVEAHVDHLLGLEQPDENLLAIVKVSGTLGTATAKRLLLPGLFFQTRSKAPFVNEEKRQEPVDMHYAERVIDDVYYQLPPGLSVEGAPQDASISWQGHANFVLKTKTDPGQIEIADLLARGFTIVKPGDYQDLRSFYQKVAAADQGQLVLAISPSAKGN